MARRKKLTASQEDYLEAILFEVRQSGSARVRDIAGRLGVAMPSVTGALRTLGERGLVNYSPYELVTLSGPGRRLAEKIAGRHRVLHRFFTEVLGVEEALAAENACRIEHAVDEAILERVRRLLAFVAGGGKKFLAAYRGFCAAQAGGTPPGREAPEP